MKIEEINEINQRLDLLASKSDEEISRFFNNISHPADIIAIFRQIEQEKWPKLLRLIPDEEIRALVVAEFDKGEWQSLLPLLGSAEIASFITRLKTDDAADLLLSVPLQKRLEALKLLSPKERMQVQLLLKYPEDTAGGLMQLELALIDEDSTVADTINIVRDLVEKDVEVLSVYVVDIREKLVGTVALADLLVNKQTTVIKSIMDKEVVFVSPLLDQEEVAIIFKKYDLLTVPVVDENGMVLGRIDVDDVMDVVSEEQEEDALHMAGISSEELLYTGAIFSVARIRLPWLSVALCCSLISAFLLHIFENTLQKAVVIFSFLPVITAMGGNVGTQSSTLLIRGFATGKFDLSNVPKFLYKEIRLSLLMGAIYGFFAGLIGLIFLTNFNFYLGLVVFFAMTLGMMTAAFLGVIAPTLLKQFNLDPAIASGPFVTTLNDIFGIIIYMAICSLFINQLALG